MGKLTSAARDSFQKATTRQPVPDWFGRFCLGAAAVLAVLILGQTLFGGDSTPTSARVGPSSSVPAQVVPGEVTTSTTGSGTGATTTTGSDTGASTTTRVPEGRTHDAVTADGSRTTIPGGAYDALVAAVRAAGPDAAVNRITVTEQDAGRVSAVVTVDPDGLTGSAPPALSWFTLTPTPTGWTATPGS